MVLVVGIDQLNAMMLTVEIEMYLWLTDQQVCFWLRVMAFGADQQWCFWLNAMLVVWMDQQVCIWLRVMVLVIEIDQ